MIISGEAHLKLIKGLSISKFNTNSKSIVRCKLNYRSHKYPISMPLITIDNNKIKDETKSKSLAAASHILE